MRIRPRLNRQEKRQVQSEKLKHDMSGSGIYLYENNTSGDLRLPKATESGVSKIGPKGSPSGKFQGDSYFMKWVGAPMNLLKLVEVIVPQKLKGENNMNNQKLILDQPDTITTQGKIEHVVVEQPVAHKLESPVQAPKDTLITEDPLDGVEIILG